MELTVSTTSLADEAISSGECEVTTWAEPIAPMPYRWAKTDRLIERGMVTAEYAVGILSAVALAIVLYNIFKKSAFLEALLGVVTKIIGLIGARLPS